MSPDRKPQANDNVLLTVRELADQAAVSVTLLRRLIARGDLVAVKVGRLVRVRLSDWRAYLDAHRMQKRPEPLPAGKRRAADAATQSARLV